MGSIVKPLKTSNPSLMMRTSWKQQLAQKKSERVVSVGSAFSKETTIRSQQKSCKRCSEVGELRNHSPFPPRRWRMPPPVRRPNFLLQRFHHFITMLVE